MTRAKIDINAPQVTRIENRTFSVNLYVRTPKTKARVPTMTITAIPIPAKASRVLAYAIPARKNMMGITKIQFFLINSFMLTCNNENKFINVIMGRLLKEK